MHHFAIAADGRDLLKGKVMILYHSYESLVIVYANAGIFVCISLGNLKRPIPTAIIDNNVFPVLIRLSQYTLNTLSEVFLSVIDRRQHAD
jgi:hypothetical protein